MFKFWKVQFLETIVELFYAFLSNPEKVPGARFKISDLEIEWNHPIIFIRSWKIRLPLPTLHKNLRQNPKMILLWNHKELSLLWPHENVQYHFNVLKISSIYYRLWTKTFHIVRNSRSRFGDQNYPMITQQHLEARKLFHLIIISRYDFLKMREWYSKTS